MSTKKFTFIIFFVSLAICGSFLLVAFLVDCWTSVGSFSDLVCSDFGETKIQPLFWSFIPLLVTSLILFFVRREVFVTWAKIGLPLFVLMLAIIFYTYNNEPRVGGWVDWGSDDQLATVLLPPLFFLISLIIIIRMSFKSRKK